MGRLRDGTGAPPQPQQVAPCGRAPPDAAARRVPGLTHAHLRQGRCRSRSRGCSAGSAALRHPDAALPSSAAATPGGSAHRAPRTRVRTCCAPSHPHAEPPGTLPTADGRKCTLRAPRCPLLRSALRPNASNSCRCLVPSPPRGPVRRQAGPMSYDSEQRHGRQPQGGSPGGAAGGAVGRPPHGAMGPEDSVPAYRTVRVAATDDPLVASGRHGGVVRPREVPAADVGGGPVLRGRTGTRAGRVGAPRQLLRPDAAGRPRLDGLAVPPPRPAGRGGGGPGRLRRLHAGRRAHGVGEAGRADGAGERYRVIRAEAFIRSGPEGPEPPRISDPTSRRPGRGHERPCPTTGFCPRPGAAHRHVRGGAQGRPALPRAPRGRRAPAPSARTPCGRPAPTPAGCSCRPPS